MKLSFIPRAPLIALLAVLVAAPPTPAMAGSRALQASCFAPEALQARPDEEKTLKLGKPMSIRMPAAAALSGATAVPRGVIRRVELPRGKKLIALTLDLCEQWSEVAGYDGAIVDYLRAQGIKATFFASGKWMATHAERTQQLLLDGLFEMGTHNWAHKNVRGLTGAELVREITAPVAAYRQQRQAIANHQCAAGHKAALQSIAEQPKLYRFPFGACNAEAIDAVQAAGMLAIQWDVSTGDPAPTQSAQAIAQEMIAHTKPGSIIIAHANGRGFHTAAALPIAIPALKAKGFEFVTVTELLAAGRPVVVDSCYDNKPGDTDKYDIFFKPKVEPGLTAAVPGATPPAAPAAAATPVQGVRPIVGR
jgi:peptidoglycan-N-acetylglucosamine deacetylase